MARISEPSVASFVRSTTAPPGLGSANKTSPPVITALRGKIRRIVWLTTDFPEPDSPTRATVERGRIRNEIPVTALIEPPGAAKLTWRSRTASKSVKCDLLRLVGGGARQTSLTQEQP